MFVIIHTNVVFKKVGDGLMDEDPPLCRMCGVTLRGHTKMLQPGVVEKYGEVPDNVPASHRPGTKPSTTHAHTACLVSWHPGGIGPSSGAIYCHFLGACRWFGASANVYLSRNASATSRLISVSDQDDVGRFCSSSISPCGEAVT